MCVIYVYIHRPISNSFISYSLYNILHHTLQIMKFNEIIMDPSLIALYLIAKFYTFFQSI